LPLQINSNFKSTNYKQLLDEVFCDIQNYQGQGSFK